MSTGVHSCPFLSTHVTFDRAIARSPQEPVLQSRHGKSVASSICGNEAQSGCQGIPSCLVAENPYKSDHFCECEFFTPMISTACNFNALKCTDFRVATPVRQRPGSEGRSPRVHKRLPLALCVFALNSNRQNRRMRRFLYLLDHAAPVAYNKSKSTYADFPCDDN